MPICRNADCPASYRSLGGRLLVNMVRDLRTAHETNRAPAPEAIDKLRELATLIYQEGPLCIDCHGQDMAFHAGPDESTEVNDLLRNIEVLQIYGALPAE